MSKVLMILGATGTQGGSVVRAIQESPNASDFTLLAVTRNPTSKSAQKLIHNASNVKLVQGNLDDPAAMFKAASAATSQPIWGVFSVQPAFGDGASYITEERQGKALVDEALKNRVKHFVYTSVDRGGDKSADNPTPVPHFISKHNIETHLREKTADGQMTWTILRPVAFMDNIADNFFGKVNGTLWRDMLGDRPLQLIAASDIGWFAAQAFIRPDEFQGRSISLAGDEVTFTQMNQLVIQKTGSPGPTTFSFIGFAIKMMMKDLRLMMIWFREVGYGVNIAQLRQMHPELLTLSDWLDKKQAAKTG